MKNAMITYLKEFNKGKDADRVVTRLYYNDGNDYVQDFSLFANEKYMSESLLNALKNGQTLTTEQEKELQCFIIEMNFE
jgi:hypothetical protein